MTSKHQIPRIQIGKIRPRYVRARYNRIRIFRIRKIRIIRRTNLLRITIKKDPAPPGLTPRAQDRSRTSPSSRASLGPRRRGRKGPLRSSRANRPGSSRRTATTGSNREGSTAGCCASCPAGTGRTRRRTTSTATRGRGRRSRPGCCARSSGRKEKLSLPSLLVPLCAHRAWRQLSGGCSPSQGGGSRKGVAPSIGHRVARF